ncbi:MAG: sulfatase-like hydrolase/transferase [Candidatus Solibacter usitatus]|nr:sulfatase-like hydrolase/transferase [Candidatus Solibacter usitatus]
MSQPRITRRAFSASAAAPLLAAQPAPARPNILWITCEDTGPHLHACGDDYSVTPHLDQLCRRGSIYMNAWSNAPVCAPARTTIISGVYPTATGAEHMRSMTRMPDGWRMFPGYLRDAGYYCSNNVKEDYNLLKPPGTWDHSSNKAHWRLRAPQQPFFSVFNLTITHESQIRTRPHTWVHDPAKVRVPAYHPDTPEVRQDWAQYYDNITTMDSQAGRILADLDSDGLSNDTIVFFFGDHGSGMPRSKRWPYNSGLNVSIVASIPEKFRHLAPKDYLPGGKTGRLVGFVDLAPTMLSLAGIRPPAFYQGQAFMGPHEASPRSHVFGFRGRMDERSDCVRSVRNQRYVYVRNYMPHKIYGQHLNYMWETPTTRVWERLYKEGKLNAAQRKFWEPKPAEELYDLQTDRDEVSNLAASPAHGKVLAELRRAHREHELKIRDIGLLPEAEIHSRAAGGAPYDVGHNPAAYPLERVLDTAEAAASLKDSDTPKLTAAMKDPDSGVRYWGVMGLLMRKQPAPAAFLEDPAPSVRIAAAESLGHHGKPDDLKPAMDTLVELADPVKHGPYAAMHSLGVIDSLGLKAKPWQDALAALPADAPQAPERVRSEYIKRLREHIAATLA